MCVCVVYAIEFSRSLTVAMLAGWLTLAGCVLRRVTLEHKYMLANNNFLLIDDQLA